MTLILKQLFALLKVLNSDTGENQIAAGVACGLVLGFSPFLSLQTLLIIAVLFFFRVQIGMALTSSFFFKMVAYLFDPVFDKIGTLVLELKALEGIFTTLYNLPIIPYTKFYNTIVMGAGVLSILLFPVIFLVSKNIVVKYRVVIVERFRESKVWKVIKATSLYKWYAKYEQYYG